MFACVFFSYFKRCNIQMKKTDIQQSVIGIVSSAFMLLNAMFYSRIGKTE